MNRRQRLAIAAAASMAALPGCQKEAAPAPPSASAAPPAPARPSAKSRVAKLLADQLGVPPAKVVPSARFTEDLGADSLDCVEIVMATEEEFSLEIPDADIGTFQTVGDLVGYVEARQRR